jgi:O-antigen ligase
MAPALAACGVWALAGLIFAAIVNSYSRMGFIATTFSLFVMGTLALGARQLSWAARSRRRQVVTVGVVGTLALAGFVFLPPDKLIARFAQLISTDPTGEGRAQLWAETVPLIKAYPVFGCGLGGYETAFLRFKVTYPLVTDDFAHNDYLQLLAELGIVGFAIMAALAVSVVRMAVRKAVGSADPGTRYFAVACAGALAAILVHSLADFNLYIPANAMLPAWIAGMTAGLRNNPFSTADGRLTAEDVAIPFLQSPIVSQQSSIRNYRRLP